MEIIKLINDQPMVITDYEDLKNCLTDPSTALMQFSVRGSMEGTTFMLPVPLVFDKPETIVKAFGSAFSVPPAEVQSVFRKDLLTLVGLQEEDLPGDYLEAINKRFPVWITA